MAGLRQRLLRSSVWRPHSNPLAGVACDQKPRALSRALAARAQQLEQHPELGQRQVLRLVDDEAVELHPRRQAVRGQQARRGSRGREFGEYPDAGGLWDLLPHPQERLRRRAADALLVASLAAVGLRAQRRQLPAGLAVCLPVDAPAEQASADLGVHRPFVALPRMPLVPDRALNGLGESRAALGGWHPPHVLAGDLAGERAEVGCPDPARCRRECSEPLLGAASQPRRPGDVEHALVRAGLDGPPQRRRLAAAGASPEHPHRALVGLERRLSAVARPFGDVAVDLGRLRDRQVVPPAPRPKRPVVVVVPHVAHDDRPRPRAAAVGRSAAAGYPSAIPHQR